MTPFLRPILGSAEQTKKQLALAYNNSIYVHSSSKLIDVDNLRSIGWRQKGVSSSGNRSILNQSLTSVIAERELSVRWIGGVLNVSVGGAGIFSSVQNITNLDGTYLIELLGAAGARCYRNGLLISTVTNVSGAAREPSATTTFGARNNEGSFTDRCIGQVWDYRINSVRYPLDKPNETQEDDLMLGRSLTVFNSTGQSWQPVD